MAVFVLDLDETTIVVSQRRVQIDKAHSLSGQYTSEIHYNNKVHTVEFHVINPEKLTVLLEFAALHRSELLFFTSGFWGSTMRAQLAAILPLSPPAKKMLESSRFHSVAVDSVLLNQPTEDVQTMPKSVRLQRIIKHYPELKGKYFVVLDNSIPHVQSFHNCENVTAILATTAKNDLSFYEQTELMLSKYADEEKEMSKNWEPAPKREPDLWELSFFPPANNDDSKPDTGFFSVCTYL